MPPPSKLGMRDPGLTAKPFDPHNPLNEDQFAKITNKADLEKLRYPPTPFPNLPSTTFERSVPAVGPATQYQHTLENQGVFDAINTRLLTLTPQLQLGEHIVHSWDKLQKISAQRFRPVKAHANVLNGIDFIVEDRSSLLAAIRRTKVGQKDAFVEGSSTDWKKHWPLTISFLATDGVGFREIFRPRYKDRPLDTMTEFRFDTRMGKDVGIDISALHFAIAQFSTLGHVRCNIHIDQMTVTLGGLGDDVLISPSVISHFVNELIFKTKLQGKLPDWILDAFDFDILNPHDGFLNAGIVATIVNKPNFKWTIGYRTGLNNSASQEWSGRFKFEHSIGTGIIVSF